MQIKCTREERDCEIMIANDVACIWMPHYHSLAWIQYLNASLSLSIAPSASLHPSLPCALSLSLWHLSHRLSTQSPPHPNPIVTFSHCPSVICKTAHLARYRERWEEMSHSSAKQRTITLECQLAKWCWRWREEVVAVVGGRLDEWAEEWRMTGAAPFYCAFFKDMAVF